MNIVHEMLNNICRLCTRQTADGTEMHCIFQPSQSGYFQSMLSRVTWVTNLEIQNDDGLPKKICSECFKILNHFYNFKQQCYVSDRELRHFLKNLEGELKDLITVEATEMDNDLHDDFGPQVNILNTKNSTYLTHKTMSNEKSDLIYAEGSSSNESTVKMQEVHNMDTQIVKESVTHLSADNQSKRKLNTHKTSYNKIDSSENGLSKSTLQIEPVSKNISREKSTKHLRNSQLHSTQIKSSSQLIDKPTSVQKTFPKHTELHRTQEKFCEMSGLSTNMKPSDEKSYKLNVKLTSQLKNKKTHKTKEISTKISAKEKKKTWSTNSLLKEKTCKDTSTVVFTSLVSGLAAPETPLNKTSLNKREDKGSNTKDNNVTKLEANRNMSTDIAITSNNKSIDKIIHTNTDTSSQRIAFISSALKQNSSDNKQNYNFTDISTAVSKQDTDETTQCTTGKNRNLVDISKASIRPSILGVKDMAIHDVTKHDKQSNKLKCHKDKNLIYKSNENSIDMITSRPNQIRQEFVLPNKLAATSVVHPIKKTVENSEFPILKTDNTKQNEFTNMVTYAQKTTSNNEKSGTMKGATLGKESAQHKTKQESGNSKATLQEFSSQELSQETLDFNTLKLMLKSQLKVREYPCDQCGRIFRRSNGLKAHKTLHTGETPFSCHDCGKQFTEKRYVRRHIENWHITDKPFKCKGCPKSYFVKKQLEIHERNHNNDRPYKCSICPKTYTNNRHLQTHLSSHLGVRNYHCDLCDKSFWLNSILKSHRLTHNKERNISCPLCKKTFASQRALKAHNVTHTKERPFKCKLCPSTYAHTSNLHEHMRKHTGETFNCSICNRAFTKRTKLREHLMMHTGNLHFECLPCGKTFGSKATLRKHMKKPHKNVPASTETNKDENKQTLPVPI